MLRVFLGLLTCSGIYPFYIFYKQGVWYWEHFIGMGVLCIIIVLPFFVHLCIEQVPSFREVVSLGGVMGLLCSVPFFFAVGPFVVIFAVPFCLIGMIYGLVFWFIAVYRNRKLPTGWKIPLRW